MKQRSGHANDSRHITPTDRVAASWDLVAKGSTSLAGKQNQYSELGSSSSDHSVMIREFGDVETD